MVAGSSAVSCPAAGITTIEVRAGDGDDRVTNGGALPVTMFGEDGSDVLGGGPAGEALDGGPGDDTISGGGGDDLLTGGTGADGLDGGEGLDTISYEADWPVAVDLPTGLAGNSAFGDDDRVAGIENVLDGQEEGTVTGTAVDNALAGGGGQDYVDGGRGTDRLAGGDGADVVAARDAAVDAPVSCGPGTDLAIVDPGDTGRDGRARPLRAGRRRPAGPAARPRVRPAETMLLRWRGGAADAARDDPLGAAALRPRSAHRAGQPSGAVAGALRVRHAGGRGPRHRRAEWRPRS